MMQQVFQNILVSDPPPVDPVGIHYQGLLKCSSFCGDCSQKSCRYDFLEDRLFNMAGRKGEVQAVLVLLLLLFLNMYQILTPITAKVQY